MKASDIREDRALVRALFIEAAHEVLVTMAAKHSVEDVAAAIAVLKDGAIVVDMVRDPEVPDWVWEAYQYID